MPRWPWIRILILLPLVGSLMAVRAAAAPSHGDPVLRLIEERVSAGDIDAEEGLLLSLRRALDPQDLPADLRSLAERPLRCATPVIKEVQRALPHLTPASRREVAALMTPHTLQKAAGYISAGGHFVLTYDTIGTNAVPAEDIAPANGVPDYVERVASYFEESWTRQITELGFVAPDLQGQPYEVSFEAMGNYGYTTLSTTSPGGTRIVMHNNYVGFPPNTDPEGNVWGAAKVTAAHEFKHASQYATTQWQENGFWPELDATWIEDIVYDQVNDYYNYLGTGSPISAPATSLDASGGGSYEDCVFQHWISQTWGDSTLVGFWDHRALFPTEPVLDSYQWMFQQLGTTLEAAWLDFATWNYATGSRAINGLGYQEAPFYVDSTVDQSYSGPSSTHAAVVSHLAANFSEYTGFSLEPGFLSVRVQRQIPSTLQATALVIQPTGSWALHPLPLVGADDTINLPESLSSIAKLVLIVANGNPSGGAESFNLQVQETIVPPTPAMTVDTSGLRFTVATGDSAGRILTLRNSGPTTSTLHYKALAMQSIPPSLEIAKDVTGSTVGVAASVFTPGSSADLFFSVTNNTPDLEWISGVDLTFPPGVRVDSTTAFVGGGAGDLISTGAVGDSVTVQWIDANGSWGNVKNGETATAHVYVTFGPDTYGDLDIGWTIRGDGYGGGNHTISSSLTLTGPASPAFQLLNPSGASRVALGSPFTIQWFAAGESQVRLELSRDGGTSWEILADSTANDGAWTWTATGPPTASAQLRLSSLDGSRTDINAQNFWIYQPLPWLVVAPANGALQGNAEISLQLGFDARLLASGDYTGVIYFEHDGVSGSATVPVSMAVQSTATPATPNARSLVLLGNQPNPFNPATKIHFELGESQRVVVDVYNGAGRHIDRLINAELDAGEHFIDWQSEDSRGRRVSSGVYYYTIAAGGNVQRGKMTLVK